MARRIRTAIVTIVLASLSYGCGAEEPDSFQDNMALSKPRPGMEAMKSQMLDAFKKKKRDPTKVAPNLVE